MRDLIISLFGTYSPITYTDAEGITYIPSGLAGVDIEYVLGVTGFFICLICLFKLLGVFFKK